MQNKTASLVPVSLVVVTLSTAAGVYFCYTDYNQRQYQALMKFSFAEKYGGSGNISSPNSIGQQRPPGGGLVNHFEQAGPVAEDTAF